MRIEKCWFCSSSIYPGHGICFVRNDSKVFRFCRSKCHKNFKMKRNPRKVRWTKAYRALHGKDLTGDATFEFERRRNRPERYDRNVMGATLKAMKRVGEIRERRSVRHLEGRFAGNAARELAADKEELEKDVHLIRAPASLLAGAVGGEEEEEDMDAEEEEEEEELMEEEEMVPEPKSAAKLRKQKLAAAEKAKEPKAKLRR